MRYLILILLLTSCSSGYHLKRAKLHLAKAEAKGAAVKMDTVYKEITIKTPPIQVEFTPKVITGESVVFYEQEIPGAEEPAEVKIVFVTDSTTGKTTAQPTIKCPEIDHTGKLPIAINQTITAKKGVSWQSVALYIIIAFILGFLTKMFLPVIRKLLIKY